MVVRLECYGTRRSANSSSSSATVFCFAFLASMPGLTCTERSVRFASTLTPRSMYDVEVRSISKLLVDQGGLLPVRAMECQLFM